MKEILDSVMSSRRLKLFSASYVFVYLILCLIMNSIYELIPFFSSTVGSLIYKAVDILIKAPFMYGLVRGIVTKNYRFAEAISAYFETNNYLTYAHYIGISLVYEVISEYLGMLNWTVMTVVLVLLRVALNIYLITMYIASIEKGGVVSPTDVAQIYIDRLKSSAGKAITAELFMFAINFVSLLISSMAAEFLPKHNVVPVILTCITEVQYGIMIVSWPVYYLYYYRLFYGKE